MFNEKIAIVTGGGSGIGRSLASTLSRRGAHVVVADIDLKAAEKTVTDACREGKAQAVPLDVTDAAAVQALVEKTIKDHRRLDYMFNNAGTFVIDEMYDVPLEKWRRVIDVNLWGTIHGTRAAYQEMKEQKSGHIVNIASGYGLTPGPMLVPYSTSKYAVVGLSRSLRVEAAKFGIKVTVACPGFVETPMLNAPDTGKVWVKDVLDEIPFGLCSVEKATRDIIRGVERNKRVVAFPNYVRALAWLHQNIPGIGEALLIHMTAKIRKRVEARAKEASAASADNAQQ